MPASHWDPRLPPRGPGYKVKGQEQSLPYRGKVTFICLSLKRLCQPAGHPSSLGTSWRGAQHGGWDEAGYSPQPGWVGPPDPDTAQSWSHPHSTALWHGAASDHCGRPDPALFSRGVMAPGRRDACRGRGAVGTCATAQVALCKATAGHRQLVLQLGGSGDSPRLREERRRRSAEACELSMGKEGTAVLGSSHGDPLHPHRGQGGAPGLPQLSIPIPQDCGGCS